MAAHLFRHGELPLAVLALLDVRPMNGYELLSELGQRFGPRYQPSPGSLYPAITALKEDGLIEERAEGARRVLVPTPSGRKTLFARREGVAGIEERLGVSLGSTDDIDALLETFVLDMRDAARQAGIRRTAQLMNRWARELQAAARRRGR